MHLPQEDHQIAARIAAASEVFRIQKVDDWDSRADATAEGNVITVVVTDHLGRAKREYRAVIQLVAEMQTTPVVPVLEHQAEAAATHRSDMNRKADPS